MQRFPGTSNVLANKTKRYALPLRNSSKRIVCQISSKLRYKIRVQSTTAVEISIFNSPERARLSRIQRSARAKIEIRFNLRLDESTFAITQPFYMIQRMIYGVAVI